MANFETWSEGAGVLLRGMYAGRPVYIQSARVVKDTPAESVLSVWPGNECAAPAGYIQHGHNSESSWNRWVETLNDTLHVQRYHWHTNRFLIILEPERYFATFYIWNHSHDEFSCYYINFQLPFRRTDLGFDTLDLDLDIVIDANYRWRWKDVDDYQRGINSGGIRPEWIGGVEQARKEVGERLRARAYPLDGSWLNWKLDPEWTPTSLPAGWDEPA